MKSNLHNGKSAKYASDKGLISKIYNELNSEKKKKSNPINSQNLNRHFSKKDIQTANNYMKEVLNITNQMKIQITMQYQLKPVTMTVIKKSKIKCW